MRKILINAELGFTVFALLIYSGAILNLLLSGGAQENEFVEFDSSLIKIINFFIYLVTFFLLILRWKKVVGILSKDYLISSLVLLAPISLMWSFTPAATLKDSITLIGSALFGLYLASRYTIKQQLQLLAWVFGIAIILSFIFAVALPKFGIMGGVHQGKWRGVFLHKNVLGARMVISALIFFLLGNEAQKYRWTIWSGFCLSVLLMLLSASSSSLLNLVILIFAFFVFLIWRWPYQFMIPALIAIVTGGECLYLLFINSGDAIFNSIGKDATLTGRTELWPLVIEMIWKHPWLGYGFSGFWQGLDGESAYIWRAAGWTPTHPHNGFLALWLDLGLLGLSVFFLGFWRNLLKAVALLRLSKTMSSIWPILYLVYVVISNLTESGLIEPNRLNFVLYTSISLSLIIQLDTKQKYSYPVKI